MYVSLYKNTHTLPQIILIAEEWESRQTRGHELIVVGAWWWTHGALWHYFLSLYTWLKFFHNKSLKKKELSERVAINEGRRKNGESIISWDPRDASGRRECWVGQMQLMGQVVEHWGWCQVFCHIRVSSMLPSTVFWGRGFLSLLTCWLHPYLARTVRNPLASSTLSPWGSCVGDTVSLSSVCHARAHFFVYLFSFSFLKIILFFHSTSQ